MADQVMDTRTVKWAEWKDEVTAGTFPTNPAMAALPGILTNFSFNSSPNFDTYNAFKGATDTDPLSCGVATKAGETHEWSFEVKATELGLLPHALLGATVSTYTPGVVYLPFSLGLKIGTQFSTITGNVIKSWNMEFPDAESAAVLQVEGMGMDRADFSTTYLGTGSHATAPDEDDVLTMASLSSITYDSAAFSAADLQIDSLSFGVENDVKPGIDVGSSRASKIGTWSFGPRALNLELGASLLDDMGAYDDVLAGTAHTMAFTLDGKTFTYSGIKWTNAPDADCNPEDILGMTLSADPGALRLAIT